MQPRDDRSSFGAEVVSKTSGVHFRIWAPDRKSATLVLQRGSDERRLPLTRESANEGTDDHQFFSLQVDDARAGDRYGYLLDEDEKTYPDPASRFQPDGPHGLSQIVDAKTFKWTDEHWRGVAPEDRVIFEIHVGTFTQEGTWHAATKELERIKALGITLIEVMPVAEFPGKFGWGYDGVDLYAPYHVYGSPEDFRTFIDRAHALEVGVILDVVYNHIGPDGNYFACYSPYVFTKKYENEWGEALNFDGDNNAAVRRFFIENAGFWIREYHLDGLRLDATQSIHDYSARHVLLDISQRVHREAGGKKIFLVAENESQEAKLVRSEARGGYELDALWNDDFHHAAIAKLTGHVEAYYTDTRGTPQELISAIRWGYLFQGQHYSWQKHRRGRPALDLPASAFVTYLENHDQVANSADGRRVPELTSAGRWRAMNALMCLAPSTPMLFQGQEYGAKQPFLYFADHEPELATLVAKGRSEFLRQFPSLTDPAAQARLADPAKLETFTRCWLDSREAEGSPILQMYKDLLRLRREDPAIRQQRSDRIAGAVLGENAFVLRFFHEDGDRLLVVNLGDALAPAIFPEPLLAPPDEARAWSAEERGGSRREVRWTNVWSSEDPAYGGRGTPLIERDDGRWRFPGEIAVLLKPHVVVIPDGEKRERELFEKHKKEAEEEMQRT